MMQDSINSNKIKENKYKILRMSLLLGNGDDREDTINNFEDAAREIDSMNDDIYLKDLEGKFYDTLTLEEEEKKLAVLVDYIGGRVEQRMSLLSDFSNITGFELINLPPIKYQDKLDEYKSRLGYIREYLDNTRKINSLKGEISDFENKLNDAYVKKAKAEEKNLKDEEELLNRFKSIIKNIPEFNDVTLDNVDSKLNEVISLVLDSKKSLDIFDKSFATLNQAGISEAEEEEYLSYVNGAKEAYYNNKEEEYLFRIYILLNSFETEYSKILFKRNSLNDIIYDRINLRKELNILSNDVLSGLYDLIDRQYDDIKSQNVNIDNIESFVNDINVRRNEVNDLEQDNQKVEILSLLKEFCIIDTYDGMDNNSDNLAQNNIDIVDSGKDNDIINKVDDISVKDDDVIDNGNLDDNFSIADVDNAKDNQVVSMMDSSKINIEEATLKSNNVMKRVGEMLGVKLKDTKIVSVEEEKNDSVKGDNVVDNGDVSSVNNDIFPKNDDVLARSSKEENIQETKIENVDNSSDGDGFIADNIFTNTTFDADPETKVDNINSSINNENPLFSNSLGNTTIDDVMAKGNVSSTVDSVSDFWYSNDDSPLDLNGLPDVTSSNDNFFGNGNDDLSDLPDFPDLDFNFGDDKEGK